MYYKVVEDILDEFNFERVLKTMEALDWSYYHVDGPMYISDLRRAAREVLNRAYEMECKDWILVRSGGFQATKAYFGNGEYTLTLDFVVTSREDEFNLEQ